MRSPLIGRYITRFYGPCLRLPIDASQRRRQLGFLDEFTEALFGRLVGIGGEDSKDFDLMFSHIRSVPDFNYRWL